MVKMPPIFPCQGQGLCHLLIFIFSCTDQEEGLFLFSIFFFFFWLKVFRTTQKYIHTFKTYIVYIPSFWNEVAKFLQHGTVSPFVFNNHLSVCSVCSRQIIAAKIN